MLLDRRCCAVALLMLAPVLVVAQEHFPKWEVGVVAGAGWVSDYPGASQSHTRGLVVPALVYRGPLLRIDKDGIRSRLFNSPDVELDVTASAAFDAHDNDARRDMPGLDYLFGIGPQLIYKGLRGPGGPTLHLKARALFSTDLHSVDSRGYSLGPEVRWRFMPELAGAPLTVTLAVQPTWASRSLHRYFYEVEPGFATPTRPAYRAHGGYLGTKVNATVSRRVDTRLQWLAGVRSMALQRTANAGSPLLRRNASVSIGAGVVWTPWPSNASASD